MSKRGAEVDGYSLRQQTEAEQGVDPRDVVEEDPGKLADSDSWKASAEVMAQRKYVCARGCLCVCNARRPST